MSLPTIPNSFNSFGSGEDKIDLPQVAQPIFGHHSQESSRKKLFRDHNIGFLMKNKKLLLGGLTLPLLIIAVSVGVRLAGERQDLRQQASEEDVKVNIYDYSFMLSCLGNNSRTTSCLTRADVDHSGQVNNIDLGLLKKTLTEVVNEE